MVSYLQTRGIDLHDTGYRSSLWTNAQGMGLYISAHYEDPSDLIDADHPLAALVAAVGHPSMYDRLFDLAAPLLDSSQPVLDVGCNVGGMTRRLADEAAVVYAVDYSFRAALTAQAILLGRPEPLTEYRYFQEGTTFAVRPLAVTPRENVEVLVASGAAFPFRAGAHRQRRRCHRSALWRPRRRSAHGDQ